MKTAVIEILEKLSKAEVKELKKFVLSPYFITRKAVITLALYCIEKHPYYSTIDFTNLELLTEIFNSKDVTTKKVTKLFSELQQEVEKFLWIQKLLKEKNRTDAELLQTYNQLSLNGLFEKQIKKSKKSIDSLSSNDFFNGFLLQEQQHIFEAKQDKGKGDVNINNTTRELDKFYVYNKLVYSSLMKNRENISGIKYDSVFFRQMLEAIPNASFFEIPIIQCYYYAYLMLSEVKNKEYYFKTKKVLLEQQGIDKNDLRILYTFLENHVKHIFNSKQDQYKELFELYKKQIDNNLIYIGDGILSGTIRNIIIVSSNLGELEWAKSFLESIKKFIIPIHEQQEVYDFCLAYIYFNNKDWDMSHKQLANIEKMNSFSMKTVSKRLLLKIYYEKKDYTVLEFGINAFRVFITENKEHISRGKAQREREFCNILHKLMILQLKFSQTSYENLQNKINDQNFPEKIWVNSKYIEFQKK